MFTQLQHQIVAPIDFGTSMGPRSISQFLHPTFSISLLVWSSATFTTIRMNASPMRWICSPKSITYSGTGPAVTHNLISWTWSTMPRSRSGLSLVTWYTTATSFTTVWISRRARDWASSQTSTTSTPRSCSTWCPARSASRISASRSTIWRAMRRSWGGDRLWPVSIPRLLGWSSIFSHRIRRA